VTEFQQIAQTQIGATTYTVERAYRPDARETALQALRRLVLQKARAGRDFFGERLDFRG
jgi:hypothetical protein